MYAINFRLLKSPLLSIAAGVAFLVASGPVVAVPIGPMNKLVCSCECDVAGGNPPAVNVEPIGGSCGALIGAECTAEKPDGSTVEGKVSSCKKRIEPVSSPRGGSAAAGSAPDTGTLAPVND